MAVGSFSAGLSGLNANAQALSVIGNNLANINTVGFKASAVTFQDLVSQNVGASSVNPSQVGLGVGIGSISPIFSQGSVESSRVPTHMAIQGTGFFVLNGPDGRVYTRAGNFAFDSNGMLVSPDGRFVQGYTQVDPATGKIVTTGEPGNITVPPGVLRPPVASTQFRTVTNLDASAPVGSTFSAPITIYDDLGAAHVVTLTYTNTAPGAWTWSLTAEGDEVQGGTAGTPFQFATGTVTFDTQGRLTSPAADVTVTTPTWTNGAGGDALTWNLIDENTGEAALTGFAIASATTSIDQNGSPAGTISNISINSDGQILATFGAGQAVVIAQIALATFNNPQGLTKLGANLYGQTEAAGVVNIGAAGTGGRGTVIGGALEQSNVDMAQEFTQMILAQRGYQANSKTITVADQLLVDTLNLKQ